MLEVFLIIFFILAVIGFASMTNDVMNNVNKDKKEKS